MSAASQWQLARPDPSPPTATAPSHCYRRCTCGPRRLRHQRKHLHQHQPSDPLGVAPAVSRCKCCADDCRRCARQHGPAASPSVSRCPTSLIRSRSTQHTDHTPTSPPPTGLAKRRQLPVPEYRLHPSKIPGSDTRQLLARLFSGFASPPSAVLAPGPSECICSGLAITGSPWPGLVQQTDQIAASAIYPYSLGITAPGNYGALLGRYKQLLDM